MWKLKRKKEKEGGRRIRYHKDTGRSVEWKEIGREGCRKGRKVQNEVNKIMSCACINVTAGNFTLMCVWKASIKYG